MASDRALRASRGGAGNLPERSLRGAPAGQLHVNSGAPAVSSPPLSFVPTTPIPATTGEYLPTLSAEPAGPRGAEAIIAALGKPAYVWLATSFGQAWTDSLTVAQARAEESWHNEEERGFPSGRPSDAAYRAHYLDHHPAVPVPPMPAADAPPRMGRLDPAEVERLGLIPLGDNPAAHAGDAAYEPAAVHEGALLTVRGVPYRVVLHDGRFLAAVVAVALASAQPTAVAPPTRRRGFGVLALTGVAVSMFGIVGVLLSERLRYTPSSQRE